MVGRWSECRSVSQKSEYFQNYYNFLYELSTCEWKGRILPIKTVPFWRSAQSQRLVRVLKKMKVTKNEDDEDDEDNEDDENFEDDKDAKKIRVKF